MNRVVLFWENGAYIVLPVGDQTDLDGLVKQHGPPLRMSLITSEAGLGDVFEASYSRDEDS